MQTEKNSGDAVAIAIFRLMRPVTRTSTTPEMIKQFSETEKKCYHCKSALCCIKHGSEFGVVAIA